MNKTLFLHLRTALIFLLFLASVPVYALPQYRLFDIHPLLNAAKDSRAEAINNTGHIAGSYTTTDLTPKVFIYRPESGVEVIDTVGNKSAGISDINDNDQFVGTSDGGYFIYRNGWVDPAPLVYVNRINNNGDVLGIVDQPRGALSRSPAILRQDGSVIDLLANAADCDQAISGDCDADNRFDFDYWKSVSVLDLNESGQVLFYTSKRLDTPLNHFHVYLYTPEKGIKLIRSYKLNWRYLSRTYASINNNGLIAISYVVGRRSQKTFIYSMDGTELTATTIFNTQGRKRSLDAKYFNDSDVLGSEYAITFSLTDISQRTKTEDLLANLFTSDSRVYITIDDINNANVLVGHSSVDVKSRAAAFYPDSGSQGIAIDGVFSDWDGLQSYSDSLSDGGTVNWETAWAHDDDENK